MNPMMASTGLDTYGLVLAVLAAIGTIATSARTGTPPTLRLTHLVMTAAMLSMTLTSQVWVAPVALIALAFTAQRVGRILDADNQCLPCLVDLIGMAIATTAMTLQDPAGHVGVGHTASGDPGMITGVVGCLSWAACAGWLRCSKPFQPQVKAAAPAVARIGRPLRTFSRRVPAPLGLITSTVMAGSMTCMLLGHA